MQNELRHLGRREAVVAVAVACLVVLVSWVASRSVEPKDTPAAGLSSSPTPEPVLALDLPEDVSDDQVRACLARSFARNLSDVTVLYSTVQKTKSGESAVLVLRNTDGDLRLCDGNGGDYPSQAPVELADATTPVRAITNGRMAWDCDGTRLEAFNVTHWFSVSPAVARAELRFVVDGAAGDWFSAQAKNGFVHVQGWLDEQEVGAAVHLQMRLVDEAGASVPQTEVATAPQPVMACDGSSVEIL